MKGDFCKTPRILDEMKQKETVRAKPVTDHKLSLRESVGKALSVWSWLMVFCHVLILYLTWKVFFKRDQVIEKRKGGAFGSNWFTTDWSCNSKVFSFFFSSPTSLFSLYLKSSHITHPFSSSSVNSRFSLFADSRQLFFPSFE